MQLTYVSNCALSACFVINIKYMLFTQLCIFRLCEETDTPFPGVPLSGQYGFPSSQQSTSSSTPNHLQGRKRKHEDHMNDSGYGTPHRSTAPIRKVREEPNGPAIPPQLISEIESVYK